MVNKGLTASVSLSVGARRTELCFGPLWSSKLGLQGGKQMCFCLKGGSLPAVKNPGF